MNKATTISVNKLPARTYASHADEQAAYLRVISFHEPIAALLAMQPPGTKLQGVADVFWLARRPGARAFELVLCHDDNRDDMVSSGITLDMIEGLGSDDLNEIADQLQATIDSHEFKASADIVLPVWLDAPLAEGKAISESDSFELDAHEGFASLPMGLCDPRALELGAG